MTCPKLDSLDECLQTRIIIVKVSFPYYKMKPDFEKLNLDKTTKKFPVLF